MLIESLVESSHDGQTIGEFEVFYKESKKRFDEDVEFRERAHQALVHLQTGDGRFVHAWALICEMERKRYKKVYKRLGVHMEERVKHFYSPCIHETLDILLMQEGLTEVSEGDEVIFVEEKKRLQHESIERKKKPLTIVKKTGDYDNALTDLTSLWYQVKEEKPEWIIYVADLGKEEYIEMCITAARRARWLPTDEEKYPLTKFVGYSLVQDDDLNRVGKLVDLLENAKTRCKAALVERGRADEWTAKELEDTAEALGYGVVKYAHLKDFRVFKYTFDFDEMLNDKGNTGVYLLHKHAQICSIINKSGKDIEELKKTRELILEKDEERELGLHLLQFTEILEFTCARVLPDHLCKYLYELSEKFNSFCSIVCQVYLYLLTFVFLHVVYFSFSFREPLKYPIPRFQLFSALVVVDNYCTLHKPCLLFGSISVSDLSVSSEKDGWIPTDDPEFGYVDLFYRDWYEPLPIINNGYICTLAPPRSVPVIDFLDIQLDLYVLGLEDDMCFQVSDKYTRFSLSDVIYDHLSSHIARGPDGLVKLGYIVLSDPAIRGL